MKPTCRSHRPVGRGESALASAEAGQARGVLENCEAGTEGGKMKSKDPARKSWCMGVRVRAGRDGWRDKLGAGLASCRQ